MPDEIYDPDDEIYDPSSELEDDGVLDAADTLEGDPGDDPLDPGVIPPDRWSAGERYGTTLAEEQAGESLDQLLAEEEPDIDPYAEDSPADDDADEPFPVGGIADPRAGRLVAEDEGAHPDEEPDLVARDAGIDAGAATAEEAAVHVVDGEDEGAGGPD
jgi:Family of unknown function (DUF5709)